MGNGDLVCIIIEISVFLIQIGEVHTDLTEKIQVAAHFFPECKADCSSEQERSLVLG